MAASHPTCVRRSRALVVAVVLVAAILAAGCATSVDDSIDRLGGTADEREEALQELLLAQDRAVEPILRALRDPQRAAVRVHLVSSLVTLSNRIDDARILPALLHHLQRDPDPRLRAEIARWMGLYRESAAAAPLLGILADPDAEVRFQALRALAAMQSRLDSTQRAALQQAARRLSADERPDTRLEAQILVEDVVNAWAEQARALALRAEFDDAEALFGRAMAYSPDSKRGAFLFAQYCLQHGQRDRGLQLLRRTGMLLDVPRLSRPPSIDGRIDADEWRQAATARDVHVLASGHYVAIPSQRDTRLYAGYTWDALFLAAWCHDLHPDSLVVKTRGRDDRSHLSWYAQDQVEWFFDTDLDRHDYFQITANSIGAFYDGWHGQPGSSHLEPAWNSAAVVAAHVGQDFWSVELRLDFDSPGVDRPQPGDLWGFNFARCFREAEYLQWVRTFGGDAHSPATFGNLAFR